MRKIVVILLLLLVATACTKHIYVPVETTHTEYIVQHTRDTLTRSDSVYVHEYTKGDTVMIEKWRERIVYRSIATADTVLVTDTVPKPYPVEVVKEVNVLKWWQRVLMWSGGISLLIIGVLVFIKKKR